MRPTNEKDYITQVNAIIEAADNAVTALRKIAEIILPDKTPSNITPFIAELPATLKWDDENSYEYYGEGAFQKAQKENAEKLVRDAKRYIEDYSNHNWYSYTYSLSAKYEGLYELNPLTVDLAPDFQTFSFKEALNAAQKLQKELPDRFFVVETGKGQIAAGNYRLESVGVVGTLHDRDGEIRSTSYHLVHTVDWLEAKEY